MFLRTPTLLIIAILMSLSFYLPAQEVIKVGLTHLPPYAIKGAEGNWTGMSVELWRNLAEGEQLRYELVELDSGDNLVSAVASGQIDVALTTDLSTPEVDSVSFMQHHHLTTVGYAQPPSKGIIKILSTLLSKQFWMIVLYLSLLLLVVGTIIYFIERNTNEDQFGGDRSLLEGIGSGFWWAGVTMTTIGYGDKAPASLGGRVVAMLWMLVAMAVSASLTASIVSAANQKNTISFPDDLQESKLAVIKESPTADFFKQKDYSFTTVANAAEGIKMMNDGKADFVIADATALRYTVNNTTGLDAKVTGTNESPVAYALAVRNSSGLSDRLNNRLVTFILSPTWRGIVREYGGDK